MLRILDGRLNPSLFEPPQAVRIYDESLGYDGDGYLNGHEQKTSKALVI